MKRHPLYSGSGWSRPSAGRGPTRLSRTPPPELPPEPSPIRIALRRLRGAYARHERPILALAAGLFALSLFLGFEALRPKPKVYTQADIDAAVAYTLKHRPDPSRASVAAAAVMPSVVRVTGYNPDKPGVKAHGVQIASEPGAKPPADAPASVGSGVVMDEKGTILTNLHVAASAKTLKVTFSNGLVSDAYVVGAQPEDDLAVIRASQVPDDLKPATLVSTAGLKQGDEVVAVGFPFAIGPSVSSGVVSGLKREWVFDKDHRARNLIQFDAAANPGNSGGPLVNRNGEVVGIVTGILNPTKQSFFVGIGFAVPIENAARAVGQSPF
jgi:S1-C subfamily serine protease